LPAGASILGVKPPLIALAKAPVTWPWNPPDGGFGRPASPSGWLTNRTACSMFRVEPTRCKADRVTGAAIKPDFERRRPARRVPLGGETRTQFRAEHKPLCACGLPDQGLIAEPITRTSEAFVARFFIPCPTPADHRPVARRIPHRTRGSYSAWLSASGVRPITATARPKRGGCRRRSTARRPHKSLSLYRRAKASMS